MRKKPFWSIWCVLDHTKNREKAKKAYQFKHPPKEQFGNSTARGPATNNESRRKSDGANTKK